MLALYGCDGFAREVVPFVRQVAPALDIVFVDDNSNLWGSTVHGSPVISFDELHSSAHRERKISVCIADPNVRAKVVEKCDKEGLKFFSAAAPSHIRGENVTLAEGAVLCPNTFSHHWQGIRCAGYQPARSCNHAQIPGRER